MKEELKRIAVVALLSSGCIVVQEHKLDHGDMGAVVESPEHACAESDLYALADLAAPPDISAPHVPATTQFSSDAPGGPGGVAFAFDTDSDFSVGDNNPLGTESAPKYIRLLNQGNPYLYVRLLDSAAAGEPNPQTRILTPPGTNLIIGTADLYTGIALILEQTRAKFDFFGGGTYLFERFGVTVPGPVVDGSHLTPSASVGSSAGIGATISIQGGRIASVVTLTTGTATGTGALFSVQSLPAYSARPVVTCVPANLAAASVSAYFDDAGTTDTTWRYGAVSVPASTTLMFSCTVVVRGS